MPENLPTKSSRNRNGESAEWGAMPGKVPFDERSFWLSVMLVAFLFGTGWLLFNALFPRIKATSVKTNAIQNLASNIKPALMAYAADHQDHFPDAPLAGEPAPQTSNQAFRRLILNGYVNDEAPFAVKGGAACADGDISSPERILAKGENHYALAKGLLATSKASLPLVWEAPLSGHWNPTWDNSRNRAEWGSTWSDGSILVMTVGGSVSTMKIDKASPDQKGPGRLAPTEEGKNLFQIHPDGDSLGPEW